MSANSVTASTPKSASPTPAALKAKPVKLIVFNIGKLSLAIQIEHVHKVINIPTIHGSGLNPVGLTQVDNQEITVLDLHRRLFRTEADSAPANSYLVLVKTRRGEVLGIPAIETPLLLDVHTTLIRTLPESYRRSDTLEIASHIAVIPIDGSEASGPEADGPEANSPKVNRTLFLLDVERLTR